MLTAVVAACVVLLAGVLMLLGYRRARIRSDRRLEAVMERIDGHLEAISASVALAIDRALDGSSERMQPLLTLDFDALIDWLVAEAAARTGADAVVLRIEGPGGRPVVASLGASVDSELLERAFGPPDARPFRAATIDWTYSPSGEPDDARYQSAIVAPLSQAAGLPGTLVAYSTAPDAFRPEHASALHTLIEDAAIGLTNARRFADVEARILLDPATGVPNRRGYELELGREVARAHRTGRPLSVVLVEIEAGAGSGRSERSGIGVGEFARLLTRATRKSDISCRRGEREFAILLPETREAGAATLTTRLREEAKQTLGERQSTFAVGLVEWRPNETIEALDARAEAALTRPRSIVPAPDVVASTSTPSSTDVTSTGSGTLHAEPTDVLRRDALDALAREILAVRRLAHALALVVLGVEGLDVVADRLGRDTADAALSEVAQRLDDGVGSGSVHRLGPDEFLLVLAESTVDDAEALLGTLQLSLGPPREPYNVMLSGGITELAEGDDASRVLGRAEHALWQAKQAGAGTVVVALPSRRAPPHA